MIEEVVPPALEGERLDRIVSLMADVSRSDASSTIRAGAVSIDGEVASSGKVRLVAGCTVVIDPSLIPVEEPPVADATVDFEVLYADDDIIVVDKPAGLVVHPGAGHQTGTLVNGLLSMFPEIADVGERSRPGIVHRLDQGTSGLLVVSRNAASYDKLVESLSSHEVEREYVALVWGSIEWESSTIEAPIGRDPRDPLRMAVVHSGKPARTHVHVVERFPKDEMCLVECQLETGRTHQIRVHLRAAGHPVVGDPVYGNARRSAVKRPFLHARSLSFDHPRTGERVTFHSPLPADLADVLAELRSTC